MFLFEDCIKSIDEYCLRSIDGYRHDKNGMVKKCQNSFQCITAHTNDQESEENDEIDYNCIDNWYLEKNGKIVQNAQNIKFHYYMKMIVKKRGKC